MVNHKYNLKLLEKNLKKHLDRVHFYRQNRKIYFNLVKFFKNNQFYKAED